MWSEGKHKKTIWKPKKPLDSYKGLIEEKDAQEWIVNYFRENIFYAAKLIMGVELYPFQEIMIKSMLNDDYILGVLGRGMSKCAKNVDIQTHRGLIDISEAVVGDLVQTKEGMHKIINKWTEPKNKAYVITYGKSTPSYIHYQHKFYVWDSEEFKHKFVKAEDLDVNRYYMPIQVGLDVWGENHIEHNLAYYIGLKCKFELLDEITKASKEDSLDFIKGLLESDSYISNGKFRFEDKTVTKKVYNILLKVGILSSIDSDILKIHELKKINNLINLEYHNEKDNYSIPKYGKYFNKKYNLDVSIDLTFNEARDLLESNILESRDYKELETALKYNFYYDNIKSITEDEFETYGITVEKEHNFWGDGKINHNSWSTAMYAALEAIFTPDCKIGILSKTFRQCLQSDSKIITKESSKALKDVSVGDMILSKDGYNKVLNKWKNEPESGFELTTKKGYSFTAINGHRVLIYDKKENELKYKNIEDISEGDYIPIKNKYETFYQNNLSEVLSENLEVNGLLNLTEIPYEVQSLNKKDLLKFIKQLFNGSGSTFYTPHKTLAKQLQVLLLDFGIISEVCSEKTYKVTIKHVEKKELIGDFYIDKVEKMVSINNIETYDIEVEKEHCYWSEGFIHHNSKMIFNSIEELLPKQGAKYLDQSIKNISHKNDEYLMTFQNGSTIRALPLGTGEKLRGFRFHVLIVDELLLMPEKVMTEVITPFLATHKDPLKRSKIIEEENKLLKEGKITEGQMTQFKNNKMIGLSSASYKFEYLYTMYSNYRTAIETGTLDGKRLEKDGKNKVNGKYSLFQLSHTMAPLGMQDENLIGQAKASSSSAQFAREYCAQFTDDSAGFFSIATMLKCSIPFGESPCLEIFGDKDAKYILAIDPNASESENSDFFAMVLLRLMPDGKFRQVHSYGVAGLKYSNHIRYLHYLLTNFNIVYISMDNAGGVQFLRACNESKLFKESKIELDIIPSKEADFSDVQDYQSQLKKARRLYNLESKKIVYLQTFTSEWIRRANELLQASMDSRKIQWASDPTAVESELQRGLSKNIGIESIKFVGIEDKLSTKEDKLYDKIEGGEKSKARQLDFMEHQAFLADLTKTQCALIEPKTTANGTMTFDLPTNLKAQSGPNRARRDLYTALLIANWAAKCYNDFMEYKEERVEEDWEPLMF